MNMQSTGSCHSTAQSPAGSRDKRKRDFRSDIQALRAFAVLMVVGVHLWPARLPGGFAGVDVFFVISGYLITSHLYRELYSTGRIRFGRFYARRIRRLLPAAFVVLLASALGVVVFMPYHLWELNLWELVTSAGYVQNLWLTHQAVDYHAMGQATTVAQHYWSLSVEEQFYLLWPAFLTLIVLLDSRISRSRGSLKANEGMLLVSAPEYSHSALGACISRRFLAISVTLFGVLFFVFSLFYTYHSPNQAYFFTPVRFWEFALGALSAFAAPIFAANRSFLVRLLLALMGWVGLFSVSFILQPTWSFPGWWALWPTLSTVLIIVAGEGNKVPLLDLVTSLGVVQWVGNISYSIYLWHWPLIVLAPYVLNRPELDWKIKLGILSLTLALATLSKKIVEDPSRHSRLSTRKTFLAMLVSLVLIFVFIAGAIQYASHAQARQQEENASFLKSKCSGPNALLKEDCHSKLNEPLVNFTLGEDSVYYTGLPECKVLHSEDKLAYLQCDFRSTEKTSDETDSSLTGPRVFVIGDSHMEQWNWTWRELARRQHWQVGIVLAGGCPIGALTSQNNLYGGSDLCWLRQQKAEKWMKEFNPQYVLTSLDADEEPLPGPGSQTEKYTRGLLANWEKWLIQAQEVIVIANTPRNEGVRPLNCLETSLKTPVSCARSRKNALGEAPLSAAALAAQGQGFHVKLIDLTPGFCDANLCYAAVGGVAVYFDATHVQRQYSLLLVDEFERQLRSAIR